MRQGMVRQGMRMSVAVLVAGVLALSGTTAAAAQGAGTAQATPPPSTTATAPPPSTTTTTTTTTTPPASSSAPAPTSPSGTAPTTASPASSATSTPPTTAAPGSAPATPTTTAAAPGDGDGDGTTVGVPVPELPVDPAAVLSEAQVVAALARLTALDAAATVLQARVDTAQAELNTRRAALAQAHTTADDRAAAAAASRAAARTERAGVDGLVVARWSGARTDRLSALLVSRSPQELLDRMTALDLIGSDLTTTLAAATDARSVAEATQGVAEEAERSADALAATAATAQTAVVAERTRLVAQTTEAGELLARLLGQDAALTGTDPTVAVRLAASARVEAARAARATTGSLDFVVVPTEGRISSTFGLRGSELHQGLDIANVKNTPIVAAADGVVVSAGPAQGFGLWVRVQHADGTITIYGHVDSFVVTVGQRVTAGELVALMGNRGESTGTHLHLGVVAPGGGYVDPQRWLAAHGVTIV